MTRSIPVVDYQGVARLVEPDTTVVVGSPAWFAWLEGTNSFSFRGERGSFTAYKETRTPTRAYWKAYRHLGDRTQRVYLGRSAELTLERLIQASAALASLASANSRPAHAAPRPPAAARREEGQDNPPPGTSALRVLSAGVPLSPPVVQDSADALHLLATKLVLPNALPELVLRPRLMNQLDAAVAAGLKLTLIAAPAGSGKTTIVTQWLREARQLRVAWISLDPEDNQLPRFLAYLIAAVETVQPDLGAEAWAGLRASAERPDARAILTSLINALVGAPWALVLVLDDYHVLSHQPIHDAVAFFLDRMPPTVHVVITSRANPGLPLARLRARRELLELRAADLHFTAEETRRLFSERAGIALHPEAVSALERRTEGWVTGLQLAVLSLQHQRPAEIRQFIDAFSGSDTYVFDYLVDEVFQHQPEEVRAFLLRTAVLRRLCGPLCAAVTGHAGAQSLLETLSRANLFLVGLDNQRTWYRYHQLFRDFLQERLTQMVTEPERALLHRRASNWFEQQGLIGEAVEHALAAEAWEDALRCLTPLMTIERLYEFYLDWPRWIARLPDAALQRHPQRSLHLAWVLLRTNQPAAARGLLQRLDGMDATVDPVIPGLVLSFRALASTFQGDMAQTEQLAREALIALPETAGEERAIPLYALGTCELHQGRVAQAVEQFHAAVTAARHSREPFLTLGTLAALASAYRLRGELHQAAALFREVLRSAGDTTWRQMPMAAVGLGLICYEWNDLDTAEAQLRQGLASARQVGRERYWSRAYSALARVAQARGDMAHARELADRALAVAQDFGNPVMVAEAEAELAWLWFAQGDLPALQGWIRQRAAYLEGDIAYGQQAEALMFCRFCLAQEHHAPGSADMGRVARMLQALGHAARANARAGDFVAAMVLLAIAQACGAPEVEPEPLGQALALAATEGHIRTLVDEGDRLPALVQAHRARLPKGAASQPMRAYISRLLRAWESTGAPAPELDAPAEPLSARELAVLHVLAEGRSVEETARRLVISHHTVRTHVRNIYAKLQAHNRTQAMAVARTLGLI